MVAARHYITAQEYLHFDRASEGKHEFLGGQIIAMTGASGRHNLITMSASHSLYPVAIRKGCNIFASDTRVYIPATGDYTYPDITIVCGTPDYQDGDVDILLNPTIIIEVLSTSTESYDRGRKFKNYRSIPTLQGYILIAQDTAEIEQYIRQDDKWIYSAAIGLQSVIALPTLEATLELSKVYEQVKFDSSEGSET